MRELVALILKTRTMHYGTQMAAKYTFPYRRGLFFAKPISAKAQMRLKWMDYIHSGKSIVQCALHFDHPYRTVKYWYDRYDKYDLSSLEDRSKRPRNVRKSKLTPEIKHLIIQARKYELPGSGKVVLQKYIKNEYGIQIGQQAIQRIINEAGLKQSKKKPRSRIKRNRKHMYTVPQKVKQRAGGLVYLDVKHIRIAGKKWYQFTALDHATRLLTTKLYRKITAESTRLFFSYLDARYPFSQIEYVGTDNGSEFLGVFDEDLTSRGIHHVFSSPASPKQNPYVERVIRTVIEQQYEIYGLEENAQLQQEALDDFCYRYNYKRPHHSLNLLTPMQMFDKLTTN